MLTLHLEGRPLAQSLDLARLANGLKGYSASDIRLLVDEAARAVRKRGGEIDQEAFIIAMSKNPPSISDEDEADFNDIQQRGL
jgi:SpoVK/Ycf46/Vps4 family AAA+-type ATPase